MALNIIEVIKNLITPDTLNTLVSMLGEDKRKVESGISGAVPALLAGIAGSVSKPAGAAAFSTALHEHDPGLLDNLTGMLGGSQRQSVIDSGTGVLSTLLGESNLDGLAKAISSFSGLSSGSSKTLVGTLGPMVMGALGREQRASGLDTKGVIEMLMGQKDNIAREIPSGLTGMLSSTGVLDSVADKLVAGAPSAASTATATTREAENAAQHAARKSGSWLGRIIPLLILAVAAWAGWQYLFKPDAAEEVMVEEVVEPTTDMATLTTTTTGDAMENLTVGGIDVGGEISSIFGSTTDTLKGISSIESAQAALPELIRMNEQLQNLSGVAQDLSAEGKGGLAGIVDNSLPALRQLVDQVNAIPGVGDTLNPVLDPMMQQLEAFTQT